MNSLKNTSKAIDAVRTLEPNINIDTAALQALTIDYGSQTSSLAIKILSIFGGILGMLTFMGFMLFSVGFDNTTFYVILGIIMVICSVFILRKVNNVLLDTVGISSYIAGVLLVGGGLAADSMDENVIIFVIMIIAIVSFLLSRSQMFSMITFLTIPCCIVAFSLNNEFFELIPMSIGFFAYIWFLLLDKEAEVLASKVLDVHRYAAIRSGLLISILGFLIMLLKYWRFPIYGVWLLIPSVIFGGLILYMSYKVLLQMGVDSMVKKALVLGLIVVFIYATAYMPAILGSLFILLVGFAYNYKMALYLGILFLIYFIGQYYYDMDLTLLTKSIMMMVSGVVFLLLYWLLSKTKTTTI